MADDSARVIFELIDRSGGATAAPAASVAGAGNVPGSDYVAGFQQSITAGGAGSRLGSGSQAPPPPQPIAMVPVDTPPTVEPPILATLAQPPSVVTVPSPTVPTIAPQMPVGASQGITTPNYTLALGSGSERSTAPTTGTPSIPLSPTTLPPLTVVQPSTPPALTPVAIPTQQPALVSQPASPPPTPVSPPPPQPVVIPPSIPGSDPLLAVTRGIVKADGQVTVEELQKTLGIDKKYANDLLDMARKAEPKVEAPKTGEIPTSPPQPSSTPTLNELPQVQPVTGNEPLTHGDTKFSKEFEIDETDFSIRPVYKPIPKEPAPPQSGEIPQPTPGAGSTAPQSGTTPSKQPDSGPQSGKGSRPPRQPKPPRPPRPPKIPRSPRDTRVKSPDRHLGGDRQPRGHGVDQSANLVGNLIQQGNQLSQMTGAGGPITASLANLAGSSIQAGQQAAYAAQIGGTAGGLMASSAALGVGVAAVAVPIAVAASIDSAMGNLTSRLRNLDPRVAVADAQAELRQLYADLRSSVRLGDEAAERIRVGSLLSEQTQALGDKLLEGPAQDLNTAIKTIAASLKGWNGFLESLQSPDNPLGTFIRNSPLGQVAQWWDDRKGDWNRWLDSQLGSDPPVSSFDWFDDQPFKTPPFPFSEADLKRGTRKTLSEPDTARFAPNPGLDFFAGKF